MKIQRFRINFSKNKDMRFTGHLDLVLTWERTFRRAGLPLSYSEGFNPRPVLNLASPLPLGFISTAELGDFWLSDPRSQPEVIKSLTRSLPPGLSINDITEISEVHGKKLPGLVDRSEFKVPLSEKQPGLSDKITTLLQSTQLIRSRKNKEYDLRPLIHDISIIDIDGLTPPTLKISLYSLPNGTGRPDEVLLALGIPPLESVICRTAIILKTGDDE